MIELRSIDPVADPRLNQFDEYFVCKSCGGLITEWKTTNIFSLRKWWCWGCKKDLGARDVRMIRGNRVLI